MRFRQVHLDFHTSEHIKAIGKSFDRKQFQESLLAGHVDSVTVFAKCAHGWSYYGSRIVPRHPHLAFDLLPQMIEAAHSIDVLAPVYISVGLDEKETRSHPEWLIRGQDERTTWVPSLLEAGWHRFCLNNAYVDNVCAQIKEVVSGFDLDGLFLDISSPVPCYCQNCVKTLLSRGLDPLDKKNVWALAEEIYHHFAARVKEIVHSMKPGLPIFHNAGHLQRGRRDLITGNTHLELESLPTGGWGYDHFPVSALYAQNLGKPYLGMTGRFHTEWGEFGGYKHPNALLFETSLHLTYGARCSIGDQLHPTGQMDKATYTLIGQAYAEVAKKEAYIPGTEFIKDIGVLSLEAIGAFYGERNLVSMAEKKTLEADYLEANHMSHAAGSDIGAYRLLRETGHLFDFIDADMDFSPYKVIVIPDYGNLNGALAERLTQYTAGGGKLLLTGQSGLMPDNINFLPVTQMTYEGESDYNPLYLRPDFPMANFENAGFVVYGKCYKVSAQNAKTTACFEAPLFNRTPFQFCSHMHAPSANEFYSPAIVEGEGFAYTAFNLFEAYRTAGAAYLKDFFIHMMDALLGCKRTMRTSMPSASTATLMKHAEKQYYLQQLLYAPVIRRGQDQEIVDDIIPLQDIQVSLRLPEAIHSVRLVPQNTDLPFTLDNGILHYTVEQVKCHQMILISYERL